MAILTAADLMHAPVVSLRPDMSLAEAWDIFHSEHISGAPVVTEKDGLIGVLSQTDILYFVTIADDANRPEHSYYVGGPYWGSDSLPVLGEQHKDTKVEDVMSSAVVCVEPDEPISSVAMKMRQNHIHRVIVTDDGNVIGIITALELLRVLENH